MDSLLEEMKRSIIRSDRVQKLRRSLIGLCAPTLLLAAFSCKDDFSEPSVNGPAGGEPNVVAVNLPGVFGLGLNQMDLAGTRADDSSSSSDGNSFADGTQAEYVLADPDPASGEYYHYILIYDNKGLNPLIFPIDVSNSSFDTAHPTDHITLTVSKILSTEDNDELHGNNKLNEFETIKDLGDFLADKEAYILLNFKLTDKDFPNYHLNGGRVAGATTPEKLYKLSKSELESLQMTDYRIHGVKKVMDVPVTEPDEGKGASGDEEQGEPDIPQTGPAPTKYEDFFIMSNSVYSNGTKKLIDGTFDKTKIFPTESEARLSPALTAYVERLAAKVSVSFNSGKMKSVKFGPTGDNYDIETVNFNSEGLPKLATWVKKVDMTNGSGIKYDDQNGYTIQTNDVEASIQVLGFGVSNLEPSIRLYKDINAGYGTTWQWNDPTRHRSYWSHDAHYALERKKTGTFTKVEGYPHQFRKALDTDSVTSYHAHEGGYIYNGSNNDTYFMEEGGTPYVSYNQIGQIDLNQNIASECFLQYKSFNNLIKDYNNLRLTFSRSTTSAGVTTSFSPFYTIENTYLDQGVLTGGDTWRWPWVRAPYATATNLMLMAQITIKDNNAESDVVRTVYLGQNNIFYLRKVNLLKSKLAILNDVMLSGGNAGIQILHGQWDRHTRWGDGEVVSDTENHLDKVAWNEGSKLWIAKVEWNNDEEYPGPVNKKITTTVDGKEIISYKLEYEWIRPAFIDNSDGVDEDNQDLNLIPAEISGGDGQCLIAPNPKTIMGKEYRYYLAPEAEGSTASAPKMDEDKAVEISYNHLVALIHKIIGPVDVYTNGYMYYSIPIPHRYLSYGRDTNTDIWKHMGAFSVVRNNWYDITVNEISRLGTPVHDLDQPIIPVMDVKRSYINLNVELKDFHNIKQDNIPMM